jgi:hypothetical protein
MLRQIIEKRDFMSFVKSIFVSSIISRRMPLVAKELLTLPEHLSTPSVLVGFVVLDL